MAIKSMKLSCDFETTTDQNDLRVWASCAVDIDSLETVFIGNSIDAFFDFLKNKNTVCYFHNLKFDGEFILSYLLRNGYTYDTEGKRDPNTFTTLIADTGAWYSITVIFARKNKSYKKAVFYDSLKKLPFKVSQISKDFQLEDEKLEIDYKAFRPVGHELTEEERAYIVNDCRIVAHALKIQFSQGLTKMTNASDAMGGFKTIITKERFEKWFPVFPLDLDADIRRAYKGGFVYLNPKHKNRRGLRGVTLDVNSLYPSVMYYSCLPYGYPIYFEREPTPDDTYNLFIVRLECAFDLKPDHIPTIQLKNNRAFIETEYLTSSDGDIVQMTLTSVDLALFLDHYDVSNLTYISGWKFKGVTGIFKDYIEYWMHIKETTTGALRQLAKLMLNSLYGRFALNPNGKKKIPVMDSDDVVRYTLDDSETRDPVYTAMGAFITAYAREKTIRSAQSVYDRFIYADTDSLHLVGYDAPEVMDVHPTSLGAWKHEGVFQDSKYIRAKTYMETMVTPTVCDMRTFCKWANKRGSDMSLREAVKRVWGYKIPFTGRTDVKSEKKTVVTCAGMPDNIKEVVTYDNFKQGSTFDGKLMPRRFPGGVVLTETTFTLK